MELPFLHTPQIPLFQGGGATFYHFFGYTNPTPSYLGGIRGDIEGYTGMAGESGATRRGYTGIEGRIIRDYTEATRRLYGGI
jgi:hypothetical protein